ncbi:MAG: thioredoxin domain-containing protein [bacterium]
MNYKIKILIGGLSFLALLGAGCASGPQATIKSPELGKSDAPVEIIEYYDYQCPACKAAESGVMPFIIDDYVNTGKARLVFKNLAFIGPESRLAAAASLCAEEGGKFLDYQKKLYEAQGAENSGVFTSAKLKNIASEVGLDSTKFNPCLDGERYRSQVAKDTAEGGALGVNSTPTFIINGQITSGGTYLSIKRVIDKKLEEATKK